MIILRDDKPRQPLGHLPLPARKRIKRGDPLPVFDTIDEAYRITGRLKDVAVEISSGAVKRSFFVVKTSPSCEAKVALAIEDRLGVPAYVPDCIVWTRVARSNGRSRRVRRHRRLIPGYAIVKLPVEGAPFRQVSDCPGVLGFVYERGRPGILPPTFVADLVIAERGKEFDYTIRRRDRDATGALPSIWSWIHADVPAVVTDGPFASFDCIIRSVDMAKFRAEVEVSIFGGARTVNVEFDQIARS